MHTVKKKVSISIVLFAVLLPLFLQGQRANRPFAVSTEFLVTRDFSIQSPDAGQSFHVLSSGIEPAFGAMFEFPIKNNLWLGAGYRRKEHWITWTSALFKSNLLVETAHSLPIKISWKKSLGKTPLLNRFTADCSGGLLLNKMAHALIFGQNYNLVDSGGNIFATIAETYKNEDVNQVEASVSLDGAIKLNYRLHKSLHLYLGYGYTQGFWRLAKGNYRVTGPAGFVDSGTMTNKGSYKYAVLGLRMTFK